MDGAEELPELCRTCLSTSKQFEPLTTEYEQGYSLRNMLTSFCTVQLDDKLTMAHNLICKECSMEVLRAYNFKLKCEQNDIILRKKVQDLKDNVFYILDAKGVVDVSIVKSEQLIDHENKEDVLFSLMGVDVKNEDYLDDFIESDDDETLNEVISRQKLKKSSKTSKKKNKKIKNAISDENVGEETERKSGKPGRKKKPIPVELAKLIDNSYQELGYRRVYECPKCSNLCKSFRLMHKHLIKLHDISLECVADFDVLWKKERQKKGIEVNEDKKEIELDSKEYSTKEPQYKCIDCSYRCKNYEAMRKHIVGHRGFKNMHCDECQYRTSDLRRLVRHVKTMHRDERRYRCEECGFRADSKYVMSIHHTNKHLNIRPFVCHLCAKGFNSNQGLQNHIASRHEKKKNHFCPTCSKGFFIKRHLKEHLIVHSGLKPHICEHCGATFTQKPNLEKHVLTVHCSNERIFQCAECPYKAKSIYSLKSHTRRHQDRNRFYCDICARSFVTKDGVKRHMWRHMGEKRYKCLTCSYSCYEAGSLRNHARTHTDERPYPCKLCNYRSRTKERLKNHMKSHLNEQKFACQHCPYTANYRYNLVRHLKTNCGRTTRNYTPRKNKAAIDLSLLNMNEVLSESMNMANTSATNDYIHIENANVKME